MTCCSICCYWYCCISTCQFVVIQFSPLCWIGCSLHILAFALVIIRCRVFGRMHVFHVLKGPCVVSHPPRVVISLNGFCVAAGYLEVAFPHCLVLCHYFSLLWSFVSCCDIWMFSSLCTCGVRWVPTEFLISDKVTTCRYILHLFICCNNVVLVYCFDISSIIYLA